ncbi:hypothetical protein [Stenotrophomonas cyclobalanopsidis]|uniref:hypothetical protein n=1 Tax=Stenotrophomonas cyclobalanopsidis TaxID=2771362 RepID=UPI0028A5FE02|nr:hypothetical protein [Stenotrophomonas cyclobalanopsidis]
MDTITPAQKILLDAGQARAALAAQWLSAAQVSLILGSRLDQHGQHASYLRREGQLLGVYVSRPVASYRYPTWQFRADGQPVGHLAEILKVLRDFGPFVREPNGLRRTTGWGEVEWFLSPHALLGGSTPAAVLTANPSRVLLVAQVEFERSCE